MKTIDILLVFLVASLRHDAQDISNPQIIISESFK